MAGEDAVDDGCGPIVARYRIARYAAAVEIVVAASALRHGVTADDALHALRNAIDAWLHDDDGFSMVVGADNAGRLIEVGYVDSVDARIVVCPCNARTS